MRLLEDSEDSILSRVRFPDRESALLYGRADHFVREKEGSASRRTKSSITLGISSVSRDNVSYLEATIDALIARSSPEERESVTVVVSLADEGMDVRRGRAEKLSERSVNIFFLSECGKKVFFVSTW